MNKDQELEKEQEPKLIKGIELKETKLVRICKPDKKHYDYVWHDGENIDILPFKAKGSCLEGGLYFTTTAYLLNSVNYSRYLGDHWFVTIIVDDNEDVWQEPNGKWKAHRVMVTSMTRIKDLPEEVLYQMVTSYIHSRYRFRMDPFNMANREKLWCKVISFSHYYLQFVRNQTSKMCITAINKNSHMINFVYDPIMVAAIAIELEIVIYIIKWTCDLVDALMASGKYQFRLKFYDSDGFVHKYKPEDLKRMLNLKQYHEYKLCVLIIHNTMYLPEIRCPAQELIDHIYEKVYAHDNIMLAEDSTK